MGQNIPSQSVDSIITTGTAKEQLCSSTPEAFITISIKLVLKLITEPISLGNCLEYRVTTSCVALAARRFCLAKAFYLPPRPQSKRSLLSQHTNSWLYAQGLKSFPWVGAKRENRALQYLLTKGGGLIHKNISFSSSAYFLI